MDIDDSFYDTWSPYGLNSSDLDEIIGSTVSHLDSSLDNFLQPSPPVGPKQNEFTFADFCTIDGQGNRALDIDALASFTPSLKDHSHLSKVDGSFDDLMNYLDDNLIEEGTCRKGLQNFQNRNTPSPTGSCSSSSGSSTSGVHSDASDTFSRASESKLQNQFNDLVDVESALSGPKSMSTQASQENSGFILEHENKKFDKPSIESGFIPLTNHPNRQEFPLSYLKNSANALKPTVIQPTTTKVQTKPPAQAKPSPKAELSTSVPKLDKTESTSNDKPRTIFLSANDYKALMKKINGIGSKGSKINCSVNAQMPKMITKYAIGTEQINRGSQKEVNTTNCTQKLTKIPQDQVNKFVAFNPGLIKSDKIAELNVKMNVSKSSSRCNIDEKMYKKQQRMIKNRESASLSRKKKKEYVDSLETRINRLEKENCTLKAETLTLRNQLVAFAKTCKCRNGNVSEFVLNSLNVPTKGEQQHIKIAPKPLNKSLKQRMTASTVKKNVAVLFAMAFMVTLNAGNFQSYLNKQNLDGEGSVLDSVVEDPISTGRRLLWVETEEEYNQKLNRSKRQLAEVEVPPLHFLRPENRSVNATNSFGESFNPQNSNSPPKCSGGCATSGNSGNQSEYSRLARNLHKWIDGNDYFNLSAITKFGNDLNNPHGFKLTTDYLELKTDMQRQPTNPGKRKILFGFNDQLEHGHAQKQRRIDTHLQANKKSIVNQNGGQSLKLYKPKIDEEYLRLFKGIKRQDDTFYVLSFNMEHILLPASAYNKSARPKMSLLLPTGDPTQNGDIVLMQIDCEVFNTTQIELKSHMIPEKLRPTPKPNDVANNETQRARDVSGNNFNNKQSLKYQPPKEKPHIRTYFMVGPKNQAAAAASLEKPRLVKYNGSDVNNTGDIQSETNFKADNARLYARMRETVLGEFAP